MMMTYSYEALCSAMDKERNRKVLDAETMSRYASHFSALLAKSGYVRDAENEQSYDKLVRYLSSYYAWRKGECDKPARGLLLHGTKGTGKTAFMKRLSSLTGIGMMDTEQLVRPYAIGGESAFWAGWDDEENSDIILDDLGNEGIVRNFGVVAPIGRWLVGRFRAWEEYGSLTCYTTNADMAELTELYGDWVVSRLVQSCWWISLNGKDRRFAG